MFNKFFKHGNDNNNDDDFSYYMNEFNNNYQEPNNFVTENQDINNTTEPIYNETGFKNFVVKATHSKWFYPTIAVLIILIIITLFFRSCVVNNGTLIDIEFSVPTTIYLDENTEISANAIGKGNLRNTNFYFDTSNSSIAQLQSKSAITGKKVTNTIIPISTGKFALYINATLGDKETDKKTQEIIICKRFNKSALALNEITIENGKTSVLNIDLGSINECYKNIKYKSSNLDIFEISEDGKITAKKIGSSVLTITDGKDEINLNVNVIDNKNIVHITKFELNKNTTTIELGSTETLIAKITPKNASNKNIIWETENDNIATVSNLGVIKGIGKGTTKITATTEDGKLKKEVIVNVKEKIIKPSTGSGTTQPNPSKPIQTDKTPPKVTSLSMISNNPDKTIAKVNDTITVTVEFSEPLSNKPQIEIANKIVEVTNSKTKFVAALKVKSNIKNGEVALKVSGYKDKSGNTGNNVTNVTTGRKVKVYTLSNWSAMTTSRCTVGELCKTVTAYQTRTATPVYGAWSNYTQNPCDSNSDTCLVTTGFIKKTGVRYCPNCWIENGTCTGKWPNPAYEDAYAVPNPSNSRQCILCPGCYTTWNNDATYVTTCIADKITSCQNVYLYQTRSKSYSYTNWSNFTTTKCDTSNTSICRQVTTYQTRKRIFT